MNSYHPVISLADEIVDQPTTEELGVTELDVKAANELIALLTQYQTTISEQNGVSRQQVQSLVKECDVILDEQFPEESYSKMPSIQNLQVITSSIEGRLDAAMVDLGNKLWALIGKLIDWLVKAFRWLVNKQHNTTTMVKELQAAHEANVEVQGALRGAANGQLNETTSKLQEELDNAVAHYKAIYSALTSQILAEGHFVAAIKQVAFGVQKLMGLSTARVEEFFAILRELNSKASVIKGHNYLGAKVDENQGIYDLADLARPMPIGHLMDKAMELWAPLEGSLNWPDLAEHFHQGVIGLASQHHLIPMEWQIAVGTVLAVRSAAHEVLVPIPDMLYDAVKNMDADVQQHRHLEIFNHITERHAAQIDRVFENISRDLRAFTVYMDGARIAVNAQGELIDALLRCEVAALRLNVALSKNDRDPNIEKKLSHIQTKFQEAVLASRS